VLLIDNQRRLKSDPVGTVKLHKDSLLKKMLLKVESSLFIDGVDENTCAEASDTCEACFL